MTTKTKIRSLENHVLPTSPEPAAIYLKNDAEISLSNRANRIRQNIECDLTALWQNNNRTLEEKLEKIEDGQCGWFELSKDVINTCNSIGKAYEEKNNEELSKILQKTGSNFVLKNRQLTFSHRSPFDFISSFSSNSLNSSLYNNYFKNDSSFLGGAVGSFENLFSENSKICLEWLLTPYNLRTLRLTFKNSIFKTS